MRVTGERPGGTASGALGLDYRGRELQDTAYRPAGELRAKTGHLLHSAVLNDYAQICLTKLRSHATDVLDADDLATLDALLDETLPHSIARRDDLGVRTTRTTWIARRP
ncbi:hypothetical protein SAMN04488564_102165 [Lentzea waywayandensis]|uniref:Uncharacterized protein n=1 Tax=Lentzea waywayandensis TaxID=84724 RepID=A0A1I6DBH9_9PSEU|nr:hypothetical protein [Lentzea waywayandensis]SFR02721.1 hypothetical protein SAMN04488564_102165 [Lentzea waywayandensis]